MPARLTWHGSRPAAPCSTGFRRGYRTGGTNPVPSDQSTGADSSGQPVHSLDRVHLLDRRLYDPSGASGPVSGPGPGGRCRADDQSRQQGEGEGAAAADLAADTSNDDTAPTETPVDAR